MDMILNRILPPFICNALSKLDGNRIYELRLRGTVSINYGGVYYYLCENGLCGDSKQAIKLTPIIIEEVLMRAAQHSIYAVNDRICDAFISLSGGYRIGLCGEVVCDCGKIKTIKNFSSLNVRVPHEIKGCGDKVYNILCKMGMNCLVVSPPGMGKTTLLRDLARIIGNVVPIKNVLLVDERSELASVVNGKPQLDIGVNTDIICNCTKEYAFERAIRAMRPDVIITDELYGENDFNAVENAVRSGVKVLASAHSDKKENLFDKRGFREAIKNKLFDCYVFLSDRFGVGSVEYICDKDFNLCN